MERAGGLGSVAGPCSSLCYRMAGCPGLAWPGRKCRRVTCKSALLHNDDAGSLRLQEHTLNLEQLRQAMKGYVLSMRNLPQELLDGTLDACHEIEVFSTMTSALTDSALDPFKMLSEQQPMRLFRHPASAQADRNPSHFCCITRSSLPTLSRLSRLSMAIFQVNVLWGSVVAIMSSRKAFVGETMSLVSSRTVSWSIRSLSLTSPCGMNDQRGQGIRIKLFSTIGWEGHLIELNAWGRLRSVHEHLGFRVQGLDEAILPRMAMRWLGPSSACNEAGLWVSSWDLGL